jgi:hypothetical protein
MLVCMSASPAGAARAPGPHGRTGDAAAERTGAPAESAAAAPRRLAVAPAASDEALLRLGRAALERRVGDMRGVIENLDAIDFSAGPVFEDADRAAFLLAEAYLEIGARSRFVALARTVAGWRRESPYTRWIAFELAVVATEAETAGGEAAHAPDSTWIAIPSRPAGGPAPGSGGGSAGGSPSADALAAGVLLRDGNAPAALALITDAESRGDVSPLLTYLKAQALAATGQDDRAEWTRLAAGDTSSQLGRDLAGAAGIRLATEALRRGEDARPLLSRVPAGSAYAARARHMQGLAAIERGDSTQGVVARKRAGTRRPGYASPAARSGRRWPGRR